MKKVPWKGFTELKLESAEMVNHNVKKLTFALPDDDSITGLTPISQSYTNLCFSAKANRNSFPVDTTHPRGRLDTRVQTIHAGQPKW